MAASTSNTSGGGDGHGKPAAWPAYMARYEPLERLGAGTNGEVFKAWDTVDNRIVAVKRLSATDSSAGDTLIFSGLHGVARETRYLRACQDVPSAVKLRGKVVPTTSGDSYIIMDYAGRLNLHGYMEQRRARPFSEAEVRRVMKQLLEGVKTVHGHGITHLDIRPENVILDDGTEDRTQRPCQKAGAPVLKVPRGEDIFYMLGGFGMSRMSEKPEVEILTPYSAPELLLRSREYGDRVDTWGLGCIMADLLSGTGAPTFGIDGDEDSGRASSELEPGQETSAPKIGRFCPSKPPLEQPFCTKPSRRCTVGARAAAQASRALAPPLDSDEKIMRKVFRVVDPQGIKDWPGYAAIPADLKSKLPGKKKSGIAAELKSKLLGDHLRRRFPWWRLSSAGFEVLSGLLERNPAKRLSAAEALEKPWFQRSSVWIPTCKLCVR